MSKTKSTTPAPSSTLIEAAWGAVFDVADESRKEVHKQVAALIALTTEALAGGTRLASLVSDRLNELARVALAKSDYAGRELVTNTRDTARDAAVRASETARTLVGTRDAA